MYKKTVYFSRHVTVVFSTGLGDFLRFNGVLPPRHDEITASQSYDCDDSPSLHLDDFGGQPSDIIMKRLCSCCNVLTMIWNVKYNHVTDNYCQT